jgi:hypothetical protein
MGKYVVYGDREILCELKVVGWDQRINTSVVFVNEKKYSLY